MARSRKNGQIKNLRLMSDIGKICFFREICGFLLGLIRKEYEIGVFVISVTGALRI